MPKRVGFLYEKMLNKAFIQNAILCAAAKKRKRKDVQKVLRNMDKCVDYLYDLMASESYAPSEPRRKTIYDQSGQKWRDIQYMRFFPDGVVQWMVVEAMKPVFLRSMWPWSCASVPGRGGERQMKYLKRCLRDDRKGTKYALQMDVRKYYPSIDTGKLMALLERKVKDPKTLKLIKTILDTCSPGLAIGYYLNQWLANFYLEPVDWEISKIDGVKYYCRYMDNMTVLGPNKKKLHAARRKIETLLGEIGLTMKGDWQVYPVKKRLVNSVGYRFGHGVTLAKKRTLLRFTRRVRKAVKMQKKKAAVPFRLAAGLLSKAGEVHKYDGRKIYQKYVQKLNIHELKEVVRNESKRRQCAQQCV